MHLWIIAMTSGWHKINLALHEVHFSTIHMQQISLPFFIRMRIACVLRLHPVTQMQDTHYVPNEYSYAIPHFRLLPLHLNQPFSKRMLHVFKVLCARTSFGLPGQILASFSVRPDHFWSPKSVRPDRFFPRTKFFVTIPKKSRPAFALALSFSLKAVFHDNSLDSWLKLFMLRRKRSKLKWTSLVIQKKILRRFLLWIVQFIWVHNNFHPAIYLVAQASCLCLNILKTW